MVQAFISRPCGGVRKKFQNLDMDKKEVSVSILIKKEKKLSGYTFSTISVTLPSCFSRVMRKRTFSSPIV